MILLLGGRGRVGAALARSHGGSLRLLDRDDYATWSQDNAVETVERGLARLASPGDLVCVASGLLDPAASPDALHAVNVVLPRNVLAAGERLGLRTMTFGTILEALPTANPYVRSKIALGEHVAARAAAGAQATHVRLHTLFGGGAPHPFMFLGQLRDALRAGRPFEMTAGRQLREYHHVDDDAAAILHIAASGTTGVFELSHGQPVSLRAIATHVFDAFGRPDLLRLGALPDPREDNFDRVFARPALLDGVRFRDTLPAIVASLAHAMPDLPLAREAAR